jgi:hypothetical protein
MKRIVLAVIFGVASLSSISTKAQVNVNINIGSQPQWGPTGYDHVDYYYLPDVDAYYYVPTNQYIYQNNGNWIWRNSLPSQYANYNLYNGYKVVVNRNRPYLSHQNDVKQYSKYKNYNGKQGSIRDSKDNRYVNARNNKGNSQAQPNRTKQASKPLKRNNSSISRSNNNRKDLSSKNNKDNNRSRANDSRGR